MNTPNSYYRDAVLMELWKRLILHPPYAPQWKEWLRCLGTRKPFPDP